MYNDQQDNDRDRLKKFENQVWLFIRLNELGFK